MPFERLCGTMVPATPRVQSLRVFAVAWAIAVIFDFGSVHRWDRTIYDALLVFAAFATICRGGTLAPLMVMAALQGFTAVARSPMVSNHWLFMGLVNLGLVFAYLLLALRDRRARVDLAALYDYFAPVARVSLLILYFFVVFHKLNRDFLNPDVSSGALFWEAQAEVIPLLPTNRLGLLIGVYSTILIEALIPLLLIFAATRRAGIVVGVVFHALVGISPLGRFWDFSSVIYALYVLFLPEAAWQYWAERWPALRDHRIVRRVAALPAPLRLAIGGVAGGAVLAYLVGPSGGFINERPFLFFWVVYCIGFSAFILPPLCGVRSGPRRSMFRLPRPLLAVAPALVVLNALSPYLGLKTESSFAMFSNLQTETGRTNHLLMPARLQVFSFQKETVEILDTTNERLREIMEQGRLLTLFELRLLAAEAPGGSARIRYRDEVHVYERFASDAELLSPPSPLLQRFLRFRPFYADGRSGNWH